MSELLALGDADGQVRWIGIRRHQAVVVVMGIGLAGDWLVRDRSSLVELVTGLALLICALPGHDNLTAGEVFVVAVRYVLRSRWTHVSFVPERTTFALRARGDANVRGYSLQHRGRLDLSGRDAVLAHELAAFADALATSDRSVHVGLHVRSSREGADTLMSLDEGTDAPDGWRESTDLLLEIIGLSPAKSSMWLLERWRHLRMNSGLVRVLRVRDFTAVPDGRALLERLQQSCDDVTVALHFDVVSGQRAHRVVERAVHRTGSDGAASRSVGFRRTARAERSLERLAQREVLVAGGRALLRTAVYVRVGATSERLLRQRVQEVQRRAHDAGLRCERGLGRQALWYCYQLPGGPGW